MSGLWDLLQLRPSISSINTAYKEAKLKMTNIAKVYNHYKSTVLTGAGRERLWNEMFQEYDILA